MKAWLLDNLGGGVGTLRLSDFPDPQPAAGEVVLSVSLAALNPADRYLAEGQYPAKHEFPHILGRDGVGVVSAIGPGVTGINIGDKRIIVRSEIGVNRRGTLAQQVAVPVESLVPVPAGWNDQEAAGATLVYLTAWQAITQWPDFEPVTAPVPAASANVVAAVSAAYAPTMAAGTAATTNRVVLVSGASGGVGVAVTHVASAMGHTVIGLSRSPEKSAEVIKQGASACFDPADADWPKKLKAHLGNRRVDLVIDNVGGELFNQMLGTLGENGRVSCVGRLAGPVPEFNTASLFFRRIQIRGVAVYSYRPEESAAIWPKIVALLAKNCYRPLVDSTYSFDDLMNAFERLRSGPMGKVLVSVPSPGNPGES